MPTESDKFVSVTPTPWAIHATGSTLGIKGSDGTFVIRKVVNGLSLDEYFQLKADFEFIVSRVNTSEKSTSSGPRRDERGCTGYPFNSDY